MRRTTLFIPLVALLLAGFVPTASARPVPRPFKGVVTGTFAAIEDQDCVLGMRTHSEATGTLSLLGLSGATFDHCTPNPPFGPAPGPILGGEFTFVAANGDSLEGTYEGQVAPLEFVEGAPVSGITYFTIEGGTGRFEDATGSATIPFTGTLHLNGPSTMEWTVAGSVTY